MKIELKYGCNPHQTPASLILPEPSPLKILNGKPGFINILDAIGAWQLANELKIATGITSAASFKHVSPAGAAIARPISEQFRVSQFLPNEGLSPAALAYIRARGGDRMCSFGDVAAVSDTVDISLANILKREVSDLIIAPRFENEALEILKSKKGGAYLILQIDPSYSPSEIEKRELFGFGLHQKRNDVLITKAHFRTIVSKNTTLPDDIIETLIVATTALKYTQSNSVCLAYDGQVIGMGAGQQSRIHCTRLACDKADKWFLQQHPKAIGLDFKEGLKRPEKTNVVDQFLLWEDLSAVEKANTCKNLNQSPEPITRQEKQDWINGFQGICLSSDAYIPFRDNIDRAGRSNTKYVAQPGSSLRDDEVKEATDEYGMVMAHTGIRCFLH